ncbi:MAG: hypothetical protein CSA66_02985 [Proteobacteria bacterium]|nr:MAG: hypothetical protein CSA66_02985 [Pseudomonadota bacterium]
MRPTTSLSRARAAALGAAGALALVTGAALGSGCAADIDIENARPRVTWVAVEPSASPTSEPARVTVWVADLEGDSVDLAAEWVDDAGVAQPLAQRAGSYGLIGLTTRDALFSDDGQPHLVLWDVSAVPSGAPVVLRFRPDDRPLDVDADGRGPQVQSPPFDIDAGLPQAVALVPTGG